MPTWSRRAGQGGGYSNPWSLPSSRCQKTQGADAGQEEVGAAGHRHELRHRREAAGGAAGLRHGKAVARGSARPRPPIAEQWITLIVQSVEAIADDPGVLHEFELALDIGIQAHEVQPH